METNRQKIRRYQKMREGLTDFLLSGEKNDKQNNRLIDEIARINSELKRLLALPIEKLDNDSGTYNIQLKSKINKDGLP